jgi:hypothetical protein
MAICTTNTSIQFPTTNNLISVQAFLCDQMPLSPVITTYMSNQFLGFLHCVAAGCVTDVSKKVKYLPACTTYSQTSACLYKLQSNVCLPVQPTVKRLTACTNYSQTSACLYNLQSNVCLPVQNTVKRLTACTNYSQTSDCLYKLQSNVWLPVQPTVKCLTACTTYSQTSA